MYTLPNKIAHPKPNLPILQSFIFQPIYDLAHHRGKNRTKMSKKAFCSFSELCRKHS